MIIPDVRHKQQLRDLRDAALRLVAETDRKWGAGRLRLLVPEELREAWDEQYRRFEVALQGGAILPVRTHAAGMQRGIQALVDAAKAAGHEPLSPQVWTVQLADGSLIAIVQGQDENLLVCDTYPEVYTLTEIGRLIEARPELRMMKRNFGGAEITGIGKAPMDWENGDDIDDLGREPGVAA